MFSVDRLLNPLDSDAPSLTERLGGEASVLVYHLAIEHLDAATFSALRATSKTVKDLAPSIADWRKANEPPDHIGLLWDQSRMQKFTSAWTMMARCSGVDLELIEESDFSSLDEAKARMEKFRAMLLEGKGGYDKDSVKFFLADEADEDDLMSAIPLTMAPLSYRISLKDEDEVVIKRSSINVRFKYPLSRPFIAKLVPPDDKPYFTRAGLVAAIAVKYQAIYDEEEASAGRYPLHGPPPGMDPGDAQEFMFQQMLGGMASLNRGASHGVHGIWGHGLGDLVLHTISYHAKGDYFTLGIDS